MSNEELKAKAERVEHRADGDYYIGRRKAVAKAKRNLQGEVIDEI